MHRVALATCVVLFLSVAAAATEADELVKATNNTDIEWIFTSAGPQASVKHEIFTAIDKVKDRKGCIKALTAALNDDTRWQGAHVVLYILTGTPRDPNVNAFGPLRVDFDKKGVAKVRTTDKKAVKEFWAQALKK